MTFLERTTMPRERERERKTFLAEIQETEPLFLTSTVEKSFRAIKEGNATCLRSGEGGRGEGREGGEGSLRSGKKTSGAVVSGFASMGRKLHVPPPPTRRGARTCVCQWFRRSNNRVVRRSYVTIQATLLLVAYQS